MMEILIDSVPTSMTNRRREVVSFSRSIPLLNLLDLLNLLSFFGPNGDLLNLPPQLLLQFRRQPASRFFRSLTIRQEDRSFF